MGCPILIPRHLAAWSDCTCRVKPGGRKYALVGANERLRSVFDLTRVATFLVVYESLAEAEANLL